MKDKKDFTIKIASIASIINEVHTEDILSQVKSRPNKCGSINLIEHLLQQKNVPYDKDAIKTLRKLYHLRFKMRPIHSGEYEIVTTLKDLGIDYTCMAFQM